MFKESPILPGCSIPSIPGLSARDSRSLSDWVCMGTLLHPVDAYRLLAYPVLSVGYKGSRKSKRPAIMPFLGNQSP